MSRSDRVRRSRHIVFMLVADGSNSDRRRIHVALLGTHSTATDRCIYPRQGDEDQPSDANLLHNDVVRPYTGGLYSSYL